MSRYTFPGKIYGQSVSVGFDRPMECYFFQLWDPTQNEDEPIISTDTRSNYEICALLDAHANLSSPIAQQVRDGIGGDFDPEIWIEMQRKEKERKADVKQLFDLVGIKTLN